MCAHLLNLELQFGIVALELYRWIYKRRDAFFFSIIMWSALKYVYFFNP